MNGDPERLERLEGALARLREDAEGKTLLVEGARDLAALEELGVGGARNVAFHRGLALDRVVEDLVAGPAPVVLLLDWDRAGGRLARRLEELLRGRVGLDLEPRRRLARACHCRSLEEVPAELASLRAGARP